MAMVARIFLLEKQLVGQFGHGFGFIRRSMSIEHDQELCLDSFRVLAVALVIGAAFYLNSRSERKLGIER